MRLVLVVITAVCAAFVAGSGAAAPSSSQARNVSYLLHAKFDLDYEVDWVETGGDRVDDCLPWWDNRGSSTVSAASLVWIPGRLAMERVTTDRIRKWEFTATGARPSGGRIPQNARVEVLRRLVQRGGPVPGCTGQTPFRAPRNDCGERAYKTQAATLLGDTAKGYPRLGGPESLDDLMARGRNIAIRVSAMPARQLYRTCLTTLHAPEYPGNFPVVITPREADALQRLEEGETLPIRRDFAGHCKAGLGATSSCHYELHMTVKIRRWASRVRCATGWCPNRFP